MVDNGLIELRVLETSESEIQCKIVVGGVVKSNKGLNLPNASLSIPAITQKDWKDLEFAMTAGADWIALSFVRSSDEVHQLKRRIVELSEFGRPVPVMAKIEKPEALEEIDGIIAEADEIVLHKILGACFGGTSGAALGGLAGRRIHDPHAGAFPRGPGQHGLVVHHQSEFYDSRQDEQQHRQNHGELYARTTPL